MRKNKIIYLLTCLVLFTACSDFLENDQEQVVPTDELFQGKDDYRSVQRGLYILQQDLVEQMIVLGELRADLLTITENATEEQIDVHNFDVKPGNQYADATGFYHLIAACNDLVHVLEELHPEVLDAAVTASWFDYLYGEVLCMRAWSYFNAVRIYGKVPYIVDQYASIEDLKTHVTSATTVSLPETEVKDFDMYGNYTSSEVITSLNLDSAWIDMDDVISIFTAELETKIKPNINNYPAVGISSLDSDGWVGMWSYYGYYSLLGQMYLFKNDLANARLNFSVILEDFDLYNLDTDFSYISWKYILTQINETEDILSVSFNKSKQQTSGLQSMFDYRFPNKYQLKPSDKSIFYWETIWDDFRIENFEDPTLAYVIPYDETNDAAKNLQGVPGDYYRGLGISMKYIKGDYELDLEDVWYALNLRRKGDMIGSEEALRGTFPMVSKYCLAPSGALDDEYANDAKVSIFRAAQIHMYYAETENWLSSGLGYNAANIVNYGGAGIQPSSSLGVRGRVGFADREGTGTQNHERIDHSQAAFYYEHDPYTNMIDTFYYFDQIGTKDYGLERAKYLEDEFLKESAREMAYEGERFYDLMRMAKRRGDNAFLADKVAEKFPVAEQAAIKAKLMDESSWYIPFYVNN